MKAIQTAKAYARSVVGDDRGQSAGVDVVVTLTVVSIVAAYLLPLAIGEIVSVDTSTWGTGASELWNIMDLIIVLGLFLFMIGLAVSRAESA